ncbi:GNAT family N-acetyltransferase [Myroides sp. LJL116]
MNKIKYIETERLILRHFTKQDAHALLLILGDKEVNRFLPMFLLESIQDAKEYLQEKYLDQYDKQQGLHLAICLKGDNIPIGYINISPEDSHDLGYGLRKDYWGKGICTEACLAVLDRLKQTDIAYITATHDVHNAASAKVMQNIGMHYQYTYQELWQPKNIQVIFRMYQLNFDDQKDRVYQKYWELYPNHYIESL